MGEVARLVTVDRLSLIADTLGRSPRTLRWIDEGYDFEVAIVDDEWVFRFPRRAGVEEALEVEIELLPVLAPALPVAVPVFEHVSREPLFVAYRTIRGTPLVNEDGDGMRAFLEALHAFDASGLQIDRSNWVDAYRDQCVEFERLVLPQLERDLHAKAKRLFDEVETLVGFSPGAAPRRPRPRTSPCARRAPRRCHRLGRRSSRRSRSRLRTGRSTARSPTGRSTTTCVAGRGSTTGSSPGTRRTTVSSPTSRRTPSAGSRGIRARL